MLAGRERPREVTTDLAAPLLSVVDEVLHDTTKYANNRIECDHRRLKARLRPMGGLRTDRTASTVIRGHAFIQNLRRGHYEPGVEARPRSTNATLPPRPTSTATPQLNREMLYD